MLKIYFISVLLRQLIRYMYKKMKKKLESEKITLWKVKKVQKSLSNTFLITFEKVIKSLFHFHLSLSLAEGESER